MSRWIARTLIICVIFMLPATTCLAERARVRISYLHQAEYSQADMETEMLFGRNLAARILGNHPLWENARANHYLNLVGKLLSRYAGRNEITFSFAILDDDHINAFATPGGYIFITRGAFRRMENEAQLAGVLGHEMVHVLERHMMRELNLKNSDGSAFGGLAGLIGGATGSVRSSMEIGMNKAVAILFERGYRIEDEVAADRTGVLIAAAAGYDPNALKRYLGVVEKFEPVAAKGSDEHPDLKRRLAAIDQTLSSNGLDDLSGASYKERFNEALFQRH